MAFDPKDPEEIITVTFDFSAVAVAPINAVMEVSVASGLADSSPASILSGTPTINGAVVTQKIINGQAGTTYLIRCRIDANDGSGSRYVARDLLPVMSF